jgi:O-antigen/teichoic acid export membrane protein
MISYLIALGRIVASSALLVFMGFITTASMFVFLALLDLGIPGAVLSVIVAAGLALVPSVVMLKRAGLKLRPAFEGAYARTSLRLGAVIQISQLLRVASGRLDLLLVFSLLGARDAGFYSTGLTVLGLVALIPGSLTYAAFPRLAEATDEDSAAMTERLGRFSTAAGLVSAVGMMILIPFLIPALFGEDFRPAIWPSLLLAPAGIMWGNQIWVARAVTARNKPRALLTSYGATLIVMVALDYLLIPHLELAGAIIGALISGAVGLFVAHREFHRAFPGRPVMASLVPRAEDFRTLLRIPGILLARLRR